MDFCLGVHHEEPSRAMGWFNDYVARHITTVLFDCLIANAGVPLGLIGRLRIEAELSFGLKPIIHFITRLFPALQINLVRAISYFLLTS